MRLLGDKPASKVGTGLTAITSVGWLAEQFIPAKLAEWKIDVPWGEALCLALAYWAGVQANQWQEGRHLLQKWQSDRRAFVSTSKLKRHRENDDLFFVTELAFTKHVSNVVITIDVFRAEITGFGPGWAWRRISSTTPVKRSDCNKGDLESIKLIEVRAVPAPPMQNALAQHNPPPPPRAADENGRYLAKLTVTAAGREPFSEDWLFLLSGKSIYPIPFDTPDGIGSDSQAFSREGCVIWVTK